MSNLLQIMPNWLIYSYILAIGLCIGSFLNVAILRGLSGEDIIFDRSKCPKCKNQLKWYMNIPLLSYIFLRGKCAYCSCHISFQYPLVEALNALLYLIAFWHFGFSLKAVFICIILSIFILLAATDYIETVILDYHSYILALVGILMAVFKVSDITIVQAIVGAIFGFFIFEIIARSGYLFVKQRMFGQGDSLIALGLGAIFGVKNLIIVIFLSLVIQCVLAIPCLAINSFKERKIQLGISYILVLVMLIFVPLVNLGIIIQNYSFYLISVVFDVIVLVYVLRNIFKDIKEKREKLEEIKQEEKENFDEFENSTFSLMPFGPAMIYAGIVGIFFMEYIKSFILKFLF